MIIYYDPEDSPGESYQRLVEELKPRDIYVWAYLDILEDGIEVQVDKNDFIDYVLPEMMGRYGFTAELSIYDPDPESDEVTIDNSDVTISFFDRGKRIQGYQDKLDHMIDADREEIQKNWLGL